MKQLIISLLIFTIALSCKTKPEYETIVRNGMIYDGNGEKPYLADIGINADTIAFIGDLKNAKAKNETDAKGKAVAPGFINMLSWAVETLIQDGRSQSDIRQGVTLEVMGEGSSAGPFNAKMKREWQAGQGDIKYKVEWNTLGEYLNFLEKKGVSCNVASFIGAGTVRTYVVGEDNRKATAAELDSMQLLVKRAMEEGAMGVGSSLIYPPDFFADTQELIALCKEAAKHGGMYISHMRSEGNKLDEAVEELITISKEANIPAEIYHIKAVGKDNWHKMDGIIKRIEKARSEGLHITADMYTYEASATGLTSAFPPSLQDGGFGKLRQRLQDPAIRSQMKKVMNSNPKDWENLYYGAGSPEKVLLLGFKQDSLKKYTGKSLAEVAKIRGTSPEETAMDLIVQDSTRIDVAYFFMTGSNLKKEIALPWVSFGSDAGSYAPEGVFLKSQPHPRSYGNFARVIGHYVRDEKILPLEKAIYKLAKLPATNLKLKKRGELKVGNYADVVIFDPEKVQDHATYDRPQQFATGVSDVFVNGVLVLKNGEHTNARPGRFVKGPGFVE
ncbi:N-acyl-D-amino-acid deacylase family protein [Dyadobacter pollutisoli]|jgi:N-acyl-D-amino-acid deacylase|uniref:D-aminoacylase n=1 Tax=Dyadobacter pollutisoli TaxID=2910158 RepID=A0A9E8SPH7_9BACT|nr:D-aminoacylase [Dyadobacter pollutisoli]WAC14746.1 D-aminoacylase [Dyadobacter pollutisoli]